MISKRKPIRDKAHLQFVRELPCLVCDYPPPSDPHHLKSGTDGSMASKPSDSFVLPLCRTHHTELHNRGEKTFFNGQVGDARHLTVALYCDSGNHDKAIEAINEFRGGR